MALVDRTDLDQIEITAKAADGSQLYDLGIQYSTGQGVPMDYVAAHKWFNLAAMKGNKDALSWRTQLAQEMTNAQIAEAQRQAREWLKNN